MAALTQFVAQQAALADQVALPPELRVQQPVRSEIEDAHAEHRALSVNTQAQESIRAIQRPEEDLRVARRQQQAVANLFSLENAGKAASAVGRGAYFLGRNVLLPAAQTALALPGAVVQGSAALGSGLGTLEDAAGAAGEGVNWLLEEPQVVREARERAMPYTSALEDARYDVPLRVVGEDEEERPTQQPRKKRATTTIQAGASSSNSAMVPSYGSVRAERRSEPLADVVQGMKGVVSVMKGAGIIGRGIVGPQAGY